MNSEEIKYAVNRIEYLEKVFDDVSLEFSSNPACIENEEFLRKVTLLTQYLESGQWQRDYQLDESGELPKELKRGILSQDGLYNLLSDIEDAKKGRWSKRVLMKNFPKLFKTAGNCICRLSDRFSARRSNIISKQESTSPQRSTTSAEKK